MLCLQFASMLQCGGGPACVPNPMLCFQFPSMLQCGGGPACVRVRGRGPPGTRHQLRARRTDRHLKHRAQEGYLGREQATRLTR